MPPSGFSQSAINGLLDFVRDTYANTLDQYRGQDLSEESVLENSIQYLERLVERSAPLALDGTVSEQGIRGLQTFVSTNYRDLIREIREGKKTEGQAMKAEIESIGIYLERFKL